MHAKPILCLCANNPGIIAFLQLIRFTETKICTKSSASTAWITWYVMFFLRDHQKCTKPGYVLIKVMLSVRFYLQMKNADYFSNYVTEDFTTYINRKRKNNCHGNHIEMQAMAEMYNRPVEVYQYGTGESDLHYTAHKTELWTFSLCSTMQVPK